MVNEPYSIKGTLVKDHKHGCSFNMMNKFDAEKLFHILTNYEKEYNHNMNYEKLNQEIIKLQMDLKVVQADLDKIKELMYDKQTIF